MYLMVIRRLPRLCVGEWVPWVSWGMIRSSMGEEELVPRSCVGEWVPWVSWWMIRSSMGQVVYGPRSCMGEEGRYCGE